MRLHVADHPLVAHKLTVLRDVTTSSATFRELAEELVTLLRITSYNVCYTKLLRASPNDPVRAIRG